MQDKTESKSSYNYKEQDNLKTMCIEQGYVPSDCQLFSITILGLIQEGKNPCVGCHINCPHVIVEQEPKYIKYCKKEDEIKKAKTKRVADRITKMQQSSNKIIMNIDCGYRDIVVYVIDVIAERMYIKRYLDLDEAIGMIPSICHSYKVDQVLIDTNGFGINVYDKIKDTINADIVPLVCIALQ